MPLRTAALCALLWCSAVAGASGWSRHGHERVARLAWQGLDERARGQIYTLLAHHPAFPHWRQEARAAADDDVRLFVVQRAAAWPDDIRSKDPANPYRLDDAARVHADWHYIDHVVCFDGTRGVSAAAPAPNIIDGLGWCDRTLRDRRRPRAERAVAVAWLLHLVGDIHQPLHCAERYSRVQPRGDRGGNEWMVQLPDGRQTPLHALWDGAADRLSAALADDASVTKGGAPVATLRADTHFMSWSWEGLRLARDTVYDRGRLPGAPIIDRALPPREVPALSADYVTTAETVAHGRVRLASRRLRGLLMRYMGRRSAADPPRARAEEDGGGVFANT